MPWERPLADRGPPPPPHLQQRWPGSEDASGALQSGRVLGAGVGGGRRPGSKPPPQQPRTGRAPLPSSPLLGCLPPPAAGGTPLLRSPFPAPTSARDPRYCPHGAPNSPRTHTAKHPRLPGVSGAGGRAAVRFPGNRPWAAAWHPPSGALGPLGRDGLFYFQRKQTQRFETGKAESGWVILQPVLLGPSPLTPQGLGVSGKCTPLEGPVAFAPEAKTPRQDAVESKYLTVNSEKVKMPTALSSLVLETASLSGG